MDLSRVAALSRRYNLAKRHIAPPKFSNQFSRFPHLTSRVGRLSSSNRCMTLYQAYTAHDLHKNPRLMATSVLFRNSQPVVASSPLRSMSIPLNASLHGVSTCIIPKLRPTLRLDREKGVGKSRALSGVGWSVAGLSRCYSTKSDVLEAEGGGNKGGEGLVKVKTEPPGPPSLMTLYMRLSKVRLGAMVVLSTIFGYLLAPGAFDVAMFASTVIGTSFTVASANSINQYLEVEYDAMMKRTKNRPLPAGHLTPNHALAFGVTTGALGTVILGTLVNPISATLAFSNIILYTLVYTPMKRVHPLNTSIGAIVGAIPPLIGWAAQTGGLEFGAWVAFLVMAVWQMPHFHALSWPLRFDYGAAGYRMLSNVAPNRVPIHVLLYTLASLGLAPFAAYTGLATPHFALIGALPSLPWIYYAFKFYQQKSNITARQTYKWSLYWLPLFFALLAFSLADDQDIDTIEEDVIAIHQQQQQLSNQNSNN